MEKILIFLFIFTFATYGNANQQQFSYEGYKVYEAVPLNQKQMEILEKLSQYHDLFDFWKLTKLQNETAHVMVSPKYQKYLENILEQNEITYSVINKNVERSLTVNRFKSEFLYRENFAKFHRFEEINSYLDELANKYKQRVSVKTVGKSYEGREMKVIKITNGDGKSGKKVIFVDAGIHAREWIAPATALFVIQQLVENFEKHKQLLENIDWHVLPVVNPDGYEYTHTNERFWRKTRQPNSQCIGTDGNRNFGFHWGEVGTSSSGCSDIYRGTQPFSEPETQIVRNILHSLKGRCKFYLTLHSYGNYLLYPWGWTSDLPETWKDLDEVAHTGAKAMYLATGNRYTVGSSTNVLYAAAGGSDDYAFGVEDVPISFTMELPGNGFDPSPSQIPSMVSEAWIGIKAMSQKVIEKYVQ